MLLDALIPLAIAAVLCVLFLGMLLLLYRKMGVKVDQGQALIINKMSRIDVRFTGAFVVPIVDRTEVADIRVKTLAIVRKGKDGLVCRDNIRADVEVLFYVRVNRTAQDVLMVAQSIGAARTGDPAVLEELFAAKFSEALKTAAKQLDFAELCARREEFKEQVFRIVGSDLGGYCLDDVSVDYVEQTPIEMLDPNNILDAEGIRKITELTSKARIDTERLKKQADKELARIEAECNEVLLRLEEMQAEAFAKFRQTTGRELTREQLQDRLADRLREMVDKVVTERVAKH